MKLREYQTQAIESCRGELRQGNLRTIVYSPTGSGKTVIAMEIIKGAIAKGKRVAFVANRIGLVSQTSRRLQESGINHGIIQGENTRSLEAQVLVCSIQTLARRGLPPIDLLVIDEAHACAGSKDYRKLIFLHSAIPVLGLTATPFSKGLGKEYIELGDQPLFQSMVVASTIRDLIGLGFLVDVEIYAPSEPDLSGVKIQRNSYGEQDYSETELSKAVDKPVLIGEIVSHWKKLAENKPTVCFATDIAHSKHIVEQFKEQGIPAEHMDCYTEDEDRQAVLARVEHGDTKVVSNVAILSEGWDFPACAVMILARPTKSLIRWIQMAGRILRPVPGKSKGTILDHSGSSKELGYPTDDLPLELDDGKPKSEVQKKVKEMEKQLPKKCPSCHYMKPPKVHVCPKCGFAPEKKSAITTEAGVLELIERKKTYTKDQKQEWWSGFLYLADERNKSRSWALAQYKTKFGVWPRMLHDRPIRPSGDLLSWEQSRRIAWAKRIKSEGNRHAA